MKKTLFYITGMLLMASCQHDVIYEADYNVTLDKENTYYVGEPVKFNITGEVDNLLFYSGETGHQYRYALPAIFPQQKPHYQRLQESVSYDAKRLSERGKAPECRGTADHNVPPH